MDEEKIEELISYLDELKFKGERFEADIQKNIKEGMPHFSVRYKRDYGREQMLYELHFSKDHQFDAYRLEGYKARYRKPVKIDHQSINGIDTAELEDRMKDIDWYAHFEKADNTPRDIKEAKIMSDLLELDNNHNQEGIKIQELLQFKYFPDRYFDGRLKELQSQYDQSREFTVTENGLCNPHLAYHIISGRLDDLYEKLQPAGLEQYLGMNVYSKLETILSGNPNAFELKCFRNEPDGYAEYIVPVTKIDDDYLADTYTVSLIPYPPIEHGIYNGIDTGELEAMMRKIDWHNDRELFMLHEDREPEFLPQVAIIQEQMYRLSQDMAEGDIADKLQLKYWADANFFEDMVQQTAWDYLDSLTKRVQAFPLSNNAKAAFNLLCGRAVLDMPLYNSVPEIIDWKKLDLSQKDTENNYPILPAGSFSKSELENVLNLLPIDGMNFYDIRNGLIRGDLLSVGLNDGRKVILQANPEQKTIDVYAPDMRPIYTNLRLDPDWIPPTKQQENTSEIKQNTLPEHKQNIFPKQSKKRHRRGKRM